MGIAVYWQMHYCSYTIPSIKTIIAATNFNLDYAMILEIINLRSTGFAPDFKISIPDPQPFFCTKDMSNLFVAVYYIRLGGSLNSQLTLFIRYFIRAYYWSGKRDSNPRH